MPRSGHLAICSAMPGNVSKHQMCCVLSASMMAVLRQVTNELGMQLHSIEETFIDMARTLIAAGIAKPIEA